jgi:lipopolysaccharide/colanic/teichoic acid biosynthesis glycosyltransferase
MWAFLSVAYQGLIGSDFLSQEERVPSFLIAQGEDMTSLRRARMGPSTPIVERPHVELDRPAALRSVSKRALDVALAIILLVLSSPIWFVAVAAIRLSSPGPVLFRQRRVGLDGQLFTCLKFRTMRHGASEDSHKHLVTTMILRGEASNDKRNEPFKLNGDDRIVRQTRWLRKSSLDELPQLLNVLRGEMSIVGPRPPLPYEVAHYHDWQKERLTVRPGITGLWQVSGRNRLTYNEMCAIDVDYIRSWSLATDLMIIVSTPWVMFIDHGGAS